MLLNAFYCAVVANAVVWCMEDGMIFSFYRKWLEKKSFEWRHGGFLTKPLGLCSFCLAGQISFWTAICIGLYPVDIIVFTSLGLFFDKAINKFYGNGN
jgi:hypothetical protein